MTKQNYNLFVVRRTRVLCLLCRSQKLDFELTDFTGRSDYGPFIENGVPGTYVYMYFTIH